MTEPKTVQKLTVRRVLRNKSMKNLVTLGPNSTMGEARGLMVKIGINSVFIVESDGTPLGVITPNDFMIHADNLALMTEPISEFMSWPVITVDEGATLEHCQALLNENGVRHLGVVDDDWVLIGVISVGDISNAMLNEVMSALVNVEGLVFGPSV